MKHLGSHAKQRVDILLKRWKYVSFRHRMREKYAKIRPNARVFAKPTRLPVKYQKLRTENKWKRQESADSGKTFIVDVLM